MSATNGGLPIALGALVHDVCGVVATFLTTHDLLTMSLVASSWDNFVRNDARWQRVFEARFPATVVIQHNTTAPPDGWKAAIARTRHQRPRMIANYNPPTFVESKAAGGILRALVGLFRPRPTLTQRHAVAMLGLDSAGKSAILDKWKLGDLVTTSPAVGFDVEAVESKGLGLMNWDVGGSDRLRPLWRHYLKGVAVLVFVVDAHDGARLDSRYVDGLYACGTARFELDALLKEDAVAGADLMVLANKQDMPNAWDVEQVAVALGLREVAAKGRHVAVLGCSTVTGEGLREALEWVKSCARANRVLA